MKKIVVLLFLISQVSYARTADLQKINGREGVSASAEGYVSSESGYDNQSSALATESSQYKKGNFTLFSADEYQMNSDSYGMRDRAFGQVRARYKFIEGFAQSEYDQRIGLNRSNAAGVGPYYNILNTAFYNLMTGVAYTVQQETFQDTNTTKRAYIYLSGGVVSLDYGRITSTVQDEQNVNDVNDYRVYSITTLKFNVTNDISTNMSYRTIFYSAAVDFPKRDTEMYLGMSMDFH